ncbi:MAG: hypothetical protein SFH39_15230 [Candidatus Magnetobacterium sp. LHC-1]|uniref:Secreted protein n=1 Tax=Candidatus Magnetobacterium casense TaxID=1455061 RepID=A0ABS6RVI2_9BACT|nr:hypothetical protein [Candidatus Magnetobacterium casensis]MBF0606055.1 hypothetical protein [Nitrospirota bacterium]MBV6340640.1 hypothetical protein [Candidatus Magnetobacterium casensis]
MESADVRSLSMALFRVVPLTVALMLYCSAAAFAEDKPTKKETIAFVQERCDNMKIANNVRSRVYLDEKDDCTFIVEITNQFGQLQRKYVVPLKEMDPAMVKNGVDPILVIYTDFVNVGVQLNSKEDKKEKKKSVKAIHVSYLDDKQGIKKEANEESAIFICNSENSAEKVGKAMSHLIELCGGKADLF